MSLTLTKKRVKKKFQWTPYSVILLWYPVRVTIDRRSNPRTRRGRFWETVVLIVECFPRASLKNKITCAKNLFCFFWEEVVRWFVNNKKYFDEPMPRDLVNWDYLAVWILYSHVHEIRTILIPGSSTESVLHYSDLIWDPCHEIADQI